MSLHIRSRNSVIRAVELYDSMGREAFLDQFGYGRARRYFLRQGGKYYDSKAIAGVAAGLEHPDGVPLPPSDFSGGEATVRRALEDLGFAVVVNDLGEDPGWSPIVLVQNEATVGGEYDFWEDHTGVQYQYPNQYRNRIRSGRPFVYYRGVRRADGSRGEQEYFGRGVIGRTWLDPSQPADIPKKDRRWYCAVEDFEEFSKPVPAKRADGSNIEGLTGSMAWRTGVRELSITAYNEISSFAGGRSLTRDRSFVPVGAATPSEVEIGEVLRVRCASVKDSGNAKYRGRPKTDTKAIGDLGEEAVYHWLKRTLPESSRDTIDWIAQRGETPGYDIQYVSPDGTEIGVEVKSTVLFSFGSIDLTGNEWEAARRMRERYRLALVARVRTPKPLIAVIEDPYGKFEAGGLSLEVTGVRLRLESDHSGGGL